MTTKTFKEDFRKKTKSIANIMIEAMFSDYILYKNGKRIGVLFDNKLLLVSTENLKKLLPDAPEETSFDWGYYKLICIEGLENIVLLEQAINTTYNDLYFEQEFVADIAAMIESYASYPDIMTKLYNHHTTFLRFCYEKKLLKKQPIDQLGRIIRMYYTNSDLTENGIKTFEHLYEKWLNYNDKNDDKSEARTVDTKTLEKYYTKILAEQGIV
ncbi:hypothetical protein [Sphingobacterium puteale]|nr:hypothetical protein [Sphingobacterium puteale]